MINRKKKQSFFMILVLCLLMLPFFSMNRTYAAENTASDKTVSYQHIYDEAELLSTKEYSKLEELCKNYSDESGVTLMILTHNNKKAPDGEIYIETFVDELANKDVVVLLVDMYNRDVLIHGYGIAEIYIHSKRGDAILEEIIPFLKDDNYAKAFELFLEQSVAYLKDDSELNYDNNYIYNNPNGTRNPGSTTTNDYVSYPGYQGYDVGYSYQNNKTKDILKNPFVQLIISLLTGGIVVGIMAYRSGGTMTAGAHNYMDQKNSRLLGRRDDYLHTRVTKVRKPTQNNNSGGGFNAGGFKGGISSGGRSHSSSRGKF